MEERAIPQPMNYGSIKPQSVESQLRLAKFPPQSTVANHPHTSSIRFMLNDNGFWDPYSAYIRIKVSPTNLGLGEIMRLDHSAHSLIQTMIIRVAGQEIERIDNYALMASIFNDMSYSTEQRNAHFFEGFGCDSNSSGPLQGVGLHNMGIDTFITSQNVVATALDPEVMQYNRGATFTTLGGRKRYNTAAEPPGAQPVAGNLANGFFSATQPDSIAPLDYFQDMPSQQRKAYPGEANLNCGGLTSNFNSHCREPAFFDFRSQNNAAIPGLRGISATRPTAQNVNSQAGITNWEIVTGLNGGAVMQENVALLVQPPFVPDYNAFNIAAVTRIPQTNYVHNAAIPDYAPNTNEFHNQTGYSRAVGVADLPLFSVQGGTVQDGMLRDVEACTELEFIIPLMSGIFGVLMPGDNLRYIPLSYMVNLEFEFIFNPYAFTNSNPANGQRGFKVTEMNLFANVLNFQTDVHDAIDNVVAQTGLNIVSQSILSGPNLHIPTNSVPTSFPISLSLKSLKALFITFLYEGYKHSSMLRMLSRVSHNLTSMQVRIGATAFFPSLPVEGFAGDSMGCTPFVAELYKSFGRLHDITTDTGIQPLTYATDTAFGGCHDMQVQEICNDGISLQFADDLMIPIGKNVTRNGSLSSIVGRNIFGISMTNISTDMSTLSGVNTLVASPLEVLIRSNGKSKAVPSNGYSFALHDIVIYIRPDLQIKILGR